MGSEAEAEIVCVTGASGFIGSWLVMKLLDRGYLVRATVRDPENKKKVKHLLDLPHASTKLTLWKADLNEVGSYDEVIQGCSGVFHVATPMDFESQEPEHYLGRRRVPQQVISRIQCSYQASSNSIDEKPQIANFSSKKLIEAGFEFKYSLEDMFVGALETCRLKGLLPTSIQQMDI
ncbi:Bifunctional dihydroflavonol 4-reductase/flavanone 4-reductase-like protein [Drosera capensis]